MQSSLKVRSLRYWILAADLLWVVVSMVSAYVIHGNNPWHSQTGTSYVGFTLSLLGAVALWTMIFSIMKLDGFWRGWDFAAIVSQLLLSICLFVVALLASSHFAGDFIAHLTLRYLGISLFAGFVIIRLLAHAILGYMYRRGAAQRVVIVGSGPVAREMATKIERHPEMLCHVVGFLCAEDVAFDVPLAGASGHSVTVQTLGVIDLLRECRVDEVIITLAKPGSPEVMNLTASCRREGIAVSFVPYPYELYLSRPRLVDVGGLPLLRLDEASNNFSNTPWKRGMDLVLGLILGLLSLPAIIVGALLLVGKKGGPFVRELRCGKFGRQFWMCRLNSDRDGTSLPSYEIMLQQLSITELPQIWNVLQGEMSLVGPRPEPPERAKHYSDWQRQRLNVKPGMTGLAQVQGLRQQHLSEEKTRFDLQYMLQPSLFVDVSLLLQTIWTLMGRLVGVGKLSQEEVGMARELTNSLEGRLPSAHSTQSSAD